MRIPIVFILLSLININIYSQGGVAINGTGNVPDPSAMLDVNSTTNGVLIPRVSLDNKLDVTTIVNPALSLLVYNTSTAGTSPNNVVPGYYYWNGTAWIPLSANNTASSLAWSLNGNAGTTVGTNFLGTTDTEDFAIYTNNTEKVRINQNGNVGIGTINPVGKLHCSGLSGANRVQVFRGENVGNMNLQVDVFGITHARSRRIQYAGWNKSGELAFVIDTQTNIDAGTSNNGIILNGPSGNVGIGTSSPLEKLHVVGSDGNNINGTHQLRISSEDKTSAYLELGYLYNVGTDSLARIQSWGGLVASDLVMQNAGGNVGIGTTTPGYKLEVSGDANITGIIYHAGSSVHSDIRYKKQINPLSNSLEKVMEMRGVEYYFRTKKFKDKGFEKSKQIGVIAQEVETIYPELVKTNKEGYKSVNYAQLTPVLIEAIKDLSAEFQRKQAEQQQIIENLVKENQADKAGLGQLEQRITMLEELLQQSSKK